MCLQDILRNTLSFCKNENHTLYLKRPNIPPWKTTKSKHQGDCGKEISPSTGRNLEQNWAQGGLLSVNLWQNTLLQYFIQSRVFSCVMEWELKHVFMLDGDCVLGSECCLILHLVLYANASCVDCVDTS